MFVGAFLVTQILNGQGYNISLSTRQSYIVGTNAFLRGESNRNMTPIKKANIYALRIGTRLGKDKNWHYAYLYPEVGIGFEYLNIHNSGGTGKPFSAYAYVNAGLIVKKRFRLSLATDFGLSYFWKPFNEVSNENNIALGSILNYHVGLGLRANFFISDQTAIILASMLNHHSNGAVTKPNLGINMTSIELGIKHYLSPRSFRSSWTDTLRSFKPYSDLTFFTGTRNVDINGSYHQFYGLHINRMFPMSGKFTYGIGIELIYDEASFAEESDISFTDQSSLASYAAIAVHLDRLSLSMDFGVYFNRKEGDRIPESRYYERLSLRYRIGERYILAAKVRAFELRKADLLEFHIGYIL